MDYNQSMTSESQSRQSEFDPSGGSQPTSPGRDVDAASLLPNLDNPEYYINRELSLLAFQRRVLEEAQDAVNPLLERFKFLSIVGSNLDEFFMVRVAGLKRQVEAGNLSVGIDGMSPAEQLKAVRFEVAGILLSAIRCLKTELLPSLSEAGVNLVQFADLNDIQKGRVRNYFLRNIFPILTPLGYDPGHPFPHISNLSLNLAVLIRDGQGEERFARVKVPDSLPQLIRVDDIGVTIDRRIISSSKQTTFLWLDDLISANLDALFPGMEIVEAHPFHVTRDAEMEIQEWEAGDLLETTEEGIRQRRFGDVVRLEVNPGIPNRILEILVENLEIEPSDIYWVEGHLPLSALKYISSLDRPDLKYAPFIPAIPQALNPDSQDEDVFSVIRRRDIILHHPYDSFQPVVNFLSQAARDPNVLAIKITLYRVGQNSPIVDVLLRAPEKGKQVAVLVELKARFDEQSNIEWAKALEGQGVHVVYGLLGVKVHAKVALVIRREGDKIRRYVHFGTGNYNTVTSHLYSDFGLLTCDEELGSDVADLFNYITGYSRKKDYLKLLVAPINLRDNIESLIRREIAHHRSGRQGYLIFKTNSLVDERIIKLLYEASQAGVKIDLIVRGICCLRPGIKDVSENIRVVSIVGRFLEHSRIYYFRNGGTDEIFIGSADLMPRNLDRRVEVLVPIEEPKAARFLRDEVLETYLTDSVKARVMQPDGTYVRGSAGKDGRAASAQAHFMERKTF